MGRVLPLLAVVLPPALTALFVARFGVDLPFWDEWVHLQTLVKFDEGTLSWADLFAQYNESRKPVARLVILALALSGLSDQRVQMALSVLSATATLALLASLVTRLSAPVHRWPTRLLLPAASTLLLSWTQWQNWLWGIQFICFLPLLGLMLTLRVCVSDRAAEWAKTAVAVATATAAGYSFAAGLLLWPVNALALSWVGRVRLRLLAVYGVCASAALLAYFTGYERPAWVPGWDIALADPARLLHHLLVLAGAGLLPREMAEAAGLTPHLVSAAGGAVVLLGGAAISLRVAADTFRRSFARVAPEHRDSPGLLQRVWVVVFVTSVGALVLASLGRSAMGVETALLSRYATFSLPGVLAVLGLMSGLTGSRLGRVAFAAAAGFSVLTAALGSASMLSRVEQVHRRQLTGRAMLTYCLTSPDATLTTFVADWPQHPLILPTAVRLSARSWLHPPVSPDGDPRTLPQRSDPATGVVRGTTLLLDDPEVHTVLIVAPPQTAVTPPRVVRVLHAATAFGKPTPFTELPGLPPGSRLLALDGPEMQARPILLRPASSAGDNAR